MRLFLNNYKMPFRKKYDYDNPFIPIQCIYGVYYLDMCVYIGSTNDMRKRYTTHVGSRNNPNDSNYNYQFYHDWREVDLNQFKFKILDVFTEVLDKKAREKIDQSYIDSEKPLSNGQNAYTGIEYGLGKAEYNKEYNKQNKDKMKQWREQNKDKMEQYIVQKRLKRLQIRLFKELPQDV